MKALILAAGMGARLRSLNLELAKTPYRNKRQTPDTLEY